LQARCQPVFTARQDDNPPVKQGVFNSNIFLRAGEGVFAAGSSHICVGLKIETYADVARPEGFQPRINTDGHGREELHVCGRDAG
jgi:hypothetical protein